MKAVNLINKRLKALFNTEDENFKTLISGGKAGTISSPTKYKWTRKTGEIKGALSDPLPANTNNLNIKVNDFEGVVAFKYKLNNNPWSQEKSINETIVEYNLNDTQHCLSIIIKNSSGVWQSENEATVYTWTIDHNVKTAILKDSLQVNDSSINVKLDDSMGVVSYKYQLDNGNWSEETDISLAIVENDISEGEHELFIIGKDEDGNWQSYLPFDQNLGAVAGNVEYNRNLTKFLLTQMDINQAVGENLDYLGSYFYKIYRELGEEDKEFRERIKKKIFGKKETPKAILESLFLFQDNFAPPYFYMENGKQKINKKGYPFIKEGLGIQELCSFSDYSYSSYDKVIESSETVYPSICGSGDFNGIERFHFRVYFLMPEPSMDATEVETKSYYEKKREIIQTVNEMKAFGISFQVFFLNEDIYQNRTSFNLSSSISFPDSFSKNVNISWNGTNVDISSFIIKIERASTSEVGEINISLTNGSFSNEDITVTDTIGLLDPLSIVLEDSSKDGSDPEYTINFNVVSRDEGEIYNAYVEAVL